MGDIWHKSFKYVLLLVLIYFPVFCNLDFLPVRQWDEARNAMNALEMYDNGNYLVTHYDGKPEIWNTKPPLLIWLQVGFMKIFGPGELAVRLPSALASLFMCIALVVFCRNYLKKFWIGFIAVLVLITTEGHVYEHVSRTGDFDALLVLFSCVAGLYIFCYCETGRERFLLYFFLCVTAGMMTKGIGALLYAPAWVIYCLIRGRIKAMLTSRYFYAGLVTLLVVVPGYYFLRDVQQPGYFAHVLENEVTGRYMDGNHEKENFWFYFHHFIAWKLQDRFLLVPCGLLIGFFNADERIRKLSWFLVIALLNYFMVISNGATKLHWYDAPMYPYLAICISFSVYFFFDLLRNLSYARTVLLRNVVPYLFLFVIFYTPYRYFTIKHYEGKEQPWEADLYEITHYLQHAVKGFHDLDNKYLVYVTYPVNNDFYLHILKMRGVRTGRKETEELRVGDKVIVCQDNIRADIKSRFFTAELETNGKVSVYSLKGKRNSGS